MPKWVKTPKMGYFGVLTMFPDIGLFVVPKWGPFQTPFLDPKSMPTFGGLFGPQNTPNLGV